MHCPLPCVPPTSSDGALTLPAARVKHHEQAAATAMTVSDEVDSCGSSPRPLLAGPGLPGTTRVIDHGWLRCCDDRCRPSTATSKRHPNPADQCKSILNPRLESSCCHNATLLLPAPLPRCCSSCAVLHWSAMFISSPCPSTHPLPIREYGDYMERSIAGRRTQGGSCRLAGHIHTSARFCALSAQTWSCSGILRTGMASRADRNRGLAIRL